MLDAPKYNKAQFERVLKQIRELTVLNPQEFAEQLSGLCGEAGVKLVFVPAIPRAHVSGVARWLNAHSPLIQMSLYGKTNDKFWFTFFHEAAHIVLHSGKKTEIFLDDPGSATQNSTQEDEANAWARDRLIPLSKLPELQLLNTHKEIIEFSSDLNIHPGIVVGRMQHDGLLLYNSGLNKLKESFKFV